SSRRHPPTTPFPYTTLFRSKVGDAGVPGCGGEVQAHRLPVVSLDIRAHQRAGNLQARLAHDVLRRAGAQLERSQRNRVGWTQALDRKSTRLNSSHVKISYAV